MISKERGHPFMGFTTSGLCFGLIGIQCCSARIKSMKLLEAHEFKRTKIKYSTTNRYCKRRVTSKGKPQGLVVFKHLMKVGGSG